VKAHAWFISMQTKNITLSKPICTYPTRKTSSRRSVLPSMGRHPPRWCRSSLLTADLQVLARAPGLRGWMGVVGCFPAATACFHGHTPHCAMIPILQQTTSSTSLVQTKSRRGRLWVEGRWSIVALRAVPSALPLQTLQILMIANDCIHPSCLIVLKSS
jgi:hypothetical protein